MQQSQRKHKRIVIKIGSSILCPDGIRWDKAILARIARQIAQLMRDSCEIVIVTSGAIASGMHVLKLTSRPADLAQLQAAAALGQNILMDNYSAAFKKNRLHPAQILLTWEDFNDRQRYLNAKNTILALLKMGGVVPIINENDTISTDEIKFGDNDRLSALVASLISADLLIMLSDVDGLWDKEKKIVRVVGQISAEIRALACPTAKSGCVGGMVTKLQAAEICVNSGVPCVIANGHKKDIISLVSQAPQDHGTLFLSKEGLAERQRWIAYNAKTKGKIYVDAGAREAIVKNKRSLLSPGIVDVEGSFVEGDVVEIWTRDNVHCANGVVSVGSAQVRQVCGKHFDKEIVHRDNLVVRG